MSDIQALHMQNNAYRDMITSLKEQIRAYDMKIKANEVEIGRQLNAMEADANGNCTFFTGDCDCV